MASFSRNQFDDCFMSLVGTSTLGLPMLPFILVFINWQMFVLQKSLFRFPTSFFYLFILIIFKKQRYIRRNTLNQTNLYEKSQNHFSKFNSFLNQDFLGLEILHRLKSLFIASCHLYHLLKFPCLVIGKNLVLFSWRKARR